MRLYLKLQCYYPKLLSFRGFQERVDTNTTLLPVVRFFDGGKESEETHEEWEQFILDFDGLVQYTAKLQLHQVDCTRDPVHFCDSRLPRISVFKHGQLLATQGEPAENKLEDIEAFLDRTVHLSTPLAPPRACCSTLNIENAGPCTGVYNKTTQMSNERVMYKEVQYITVIIRPVTVFCSAQWK